MLERLRNDLPGLIRDLETLVPYASVLYTESSGVRIQVNRMQEAVTPTPPNQGLVFTFWNGQSFFEYATNDWTAETLREGATNAAREAARARTAGAADELDPGARIERHFETQASAAVASQPLDEKLSAARRTLKAALGADPAVSNAMVLSGDSTHTDLFVNRNKIMSQSVTRTDAMVMLFVSGNGHTVEIFQGASKNLPYDAVTPDEAAIRALAADGKRLIGAPRLDPGVYDVVTDPEWSGIIAHECFGHGMETDLYTRDRALSRSYLGKPVASPIVNMFDDPSLIEEAGGFFFDDEGQLASPTHIIKDGILQRGLTDLASARILKMERSANGRRESFARKAYARMTNTFFSNGRSKPAEMIASIENGLYLRYATNGMEDPQAWGIQVEGLWAEEIREGKLTGKVYSPVIMTGFVPDLLQSISLVGDDGHISGLGMCGKGHKEWVKNTTGGPHLKMRARLA